MAWDDEMVTILRAQLQDYAATPKYTDDRLSEMILVTALSIQKEVAFQTTYTISITNSTLKPDPTSTTTRDDDFINLVTLKAAEKLIIAEIRELTRQGISIRDGSSSISLERSPLALTKMLEAYQKEYENAYTQYQMGGTAGGGLAIVGQYKFIESGRNMDFITGGYPNDGGCRR